MRTIIVLAAVVSFVGLGRGYAQQASVSNAPGSPPPAAGQGSPQATQPATGEADEIIKPGALLEISIRNLLADGQVAVLRYRLRTDGTVRLRKLSEEVKLAGLTQKQAAQKIAKAYEDAKVLQNAVVSVSISQPTVMRVDRRGDTGRPRPPTAASQPVLRAPASTCPLQAAIYELRLAPDKAAKLDAATLAAAAAKPGGLQAALEQLGQTRRLYSMEESVDLQGDTVLISNRVPFVFLSALSTTGKRVNTVEYHDIGAVLNISGQARAEGIQSKIDIQLSTIAESLAPASMPRDVLRLPTFNAVTLSHNGVSRPGEPIVVVSSLAADKVTVAHVAMITLGKAQPPAATRPAGDSTCAIKATVYEVRLPQGAVAALEASELSKATDAAALEDALARTGQAKCQVKALYSIDQSVRLSGDTVKVENKVPIFTRLQRDESGKTTSTIDYQSFGAILNVAGWPQPDGGISANMRLQVTAVADSPVKIDDATPAKVFRMATMGHSGAVTPDKPIILLSASADVPDADGRAVAYVARIVMGKPQAATQPASDTATKPAAKADDPELEGLWATMKSGDAAAALEAAKGLQTKGAGAVAFLRMKLSPVCAPDAAGVQRLIEQLDSAQYTVREQATAELSLLGASVDNELADARREAKSLETQTRAEALLKNAQGRFPTIGAAAAWWWGVRGLERIGTPEARQLLDELSNGAPKAAATKQAKEALERLDRALKTDSLQWWLARAEDEVETLGSGAWQYSRYFGEISALLSEAGRISGAQTMQRRAGGDLEANYALAAAYARAGQRKEAQKVASLVQDADARTELNCRVGIALAAAGRVEPSVPTRDSADWAAATVAQAPTIEEAAKWKVRDSQAASAEARIHAAIAAAHAAAGRKELCRKHIELADTLNDKIKVDVNAAWRAALAGDSRLAQAGGGDILVAVDKTNAIEAIAKARASAGEYDGAMATVRSLPAGRQRDAQMRLLAAALAGDGALKQAMQAAGAIEDTTHRDLALLSIVEGCLRIGDRAGAQTAADKVQSFAYQAVVRLAINAPGKESDYQSASRYDVTIRRLARIQVQAGSDRGQVIAWIDALPEADRRYHALLGAAEGIMALERHAGSRTASPAAIQPAAAAPALQQTTSQPAADAATIERLIEQLDADKQKERQAAQAELVRIGRPAMTALLAAASDTEPERSQRAKAALNQIVRSLLRGQEWGQAYDGLQCRWLVSDGVIALNSKPVLFVEVQNVSDEVIMWPGGVWVAVGASSRHGGVIAEYDAEAEGDTRIDGRTVALSPGGKVRLKIQWPYKLDKGGRYQAEVVLQRYQRSPSETGRSEYVTCPPTVLCVADAAGRVPDEDPTQWPDGPWGKAVQGMQIRINKGESFCNPGAAAPHISVDIRNFGPRAMSFRLWRYSLVFGLAGEAVECEVDGVWYHHEGKAQRDITPWPLGPGNRYEDVVIEPLNWVDKDGKYLELGNAKHNFRVALKAQPADGKGEAVRLESDVSLLGPATELPRYATAASRSATGAGDR